MQGVALSKSHRSRGSTVLVPIGSALKQAQHQTKSWTGQWQVFLCDLEHAAQPLWDSVSSVMGRALSVLCSERSHVPGAGDHEVPSSWPGPVISPSSFYFPPPSANFCLAHPNGGELRVCFWDIIFSLMFLLNPAEWFNVFAKDYIALLLNTTKIK